MGEEVISCVVKSFAVVNSKVVKSLVVFSTFVSFEEITSLVKKRNFRLTKGETNELQH